MKLRVLLLVVLLAAAGLVFPVASAKDGDQLAAIGNPCSAVGHAGGVAVDENAQRLYYTVQNVTRIYNASTVSPFGCAPAIVSNAAAPGFQLLAFDTHHASVRFWASSGATLYGGAPVVRA